jgi:PDZ domain-containing protein
VRGSLWKIALALGAVLGVVVVLWSLPGGDYLIEPDEASPLADRVRVEGEERPPPPGDVYYVDVLVRKLTLLEKLLPFTQPEGAEVVPERALRPEGTTEEERQQQSRAQMERSEEIAAAVALSALGYDVVAIPRGALVAGVAPDGPAVGKLQPEDVIVAVDGKPVRTTDQLRARIGTRQPGDDVALTVRRGSKRLEIVVETVESPVDPGRPIVGIQIEQAATIRLPIDVDIDLGDVGGPSAGLAFALEIARKLGRSVAPGCRIAATGELALDGSVLPVGGVEQKTIGARKTGVDLFLVPAGENADEASGNAGQLPVAPVETYQQALQRLTTNPPKC